MVAKICQDFPDLQPACTLFKFFEIYAEWRNWVEPVQISLSKKYKSSSGGNLRTDLIAKVDRYSQDKMVVLTPNDQLENTSYRVKEHNLLIIIQELSRGQKLLKRLKPRSKVLFLPPQPEPPVVACIDDDDLGATLDNLTHETNEESKI